MSGHAQTFPGRDRNAVFHPATFGAVRLTDRKRVAVVGGGIAGVAAAVALIDRGAEVTLYESTERLGGRVAAWQLGDTRTMSRGFHAFFRQYYNLRTLLRRIDANLAFLTPLDDYPLVRADGLTESFEGLPTKPPWSFIQFVKRSPSFSVKSLMAVNVRAALELLRVKFPETYTEYDGESAEEFLDRLNFPEGARDLALEVFARSFFAHPSKFGAGELVAMFHTYFLGSAEGLVFDVPNDDYERVIWGPLQKHLTARGVDVRLSTPVQRIEIDGDDRAAVTAGGERREYDAVVLAADPRTSRTLIGKARETKTTWSAPEQAWFDAVDATYNAPPFVVVRLWLDRTVRADRAAFLGTSRFGPLDNVSVLERFEAGAETWSRASGGSVVELHAYAAPEAVATDDEARATIVTELKRELARVYPETRDATVLHEEILIEDDCGLIGPSGWDDRPTVATPWASLTLAGDWVRCDYPVALMERAATTGFLAANELLAGWGVQGQGIWTVPMRGMLRRSST